MIELTKEQRQAVLKGEPVRLCPPEIGADIILLRADAFEQIGLACEDAREKAAWAALARKAAQQWAEENPYQL